MESTQDKSLKSKAIKIKGKDYVEVAQRILFFNNMYPEGSIKTVISYPDEVTVRCEARVYPEGIEKRVFTGHAEEDRKSTMVNQTSAVENCETSAVGRALAMMGIGVLDSVASADEVNIAKNKQAANTGTGKPSQKQIDYISKLAGDLGVTVHAPETTAEASAMINDLIARNKELKEKDEPFETEEVMTSRGAVKMKVDEGVAKDQAESSYQDMDNRGVLV